MKDHIRIIDKTSTRDVSILGSFDFKSTLNRTEISLEHHSASFFWFFLRLLLRLWLWRDQNSMFWFKQMISQKNSMIMVKKKFQFISSEQSEHRTDRTVHLERTVRTSNRPNSSFRANSPNTYLDFGEPWLCHMIYMTFSYIQLINYSMCINSYDPYSKSNRGHIFFVLRTVAWISDTELEMSKKACERWFVNFLKCPKIELDMVHRYSLLLIQNNRWIT